MTANDPIVVTGYGETTCYDVYYSGYRNYTIPADICPSLRVEIGDTCCTVTIDGGGETSTDMWYVTCSL